jgi:hypothetical protein
MAYPTYVMMIMTRRRVSQQHGKSLHILKPARNDRSVLCSIKEYVCLLDSFRCLLIYVLAVQ